MSYEVLNRLLSAELVVVFIRADAMWGVVIIVEERMVCMNNSAADPRRMPAQSRSLQSRVNTLSIYIKLRSNLYMHRNVY